MTWKLAAVLEPNAARHKTIAAALTKAGLKVTPARNAHALTREQVVVLGSSPQGSSRGAREVRNKLPHAFVFAAMRTGFKAAWADAVLPLPVSPPDLRVRLGELHRELAPWRRCRRRDPGDGILDPTTNFYTFGHFKEVLFVEVKRARRYGFPLALALLAFDPLSGAHRATRCSRSSWAVSRWRFDVRSATPTTPFNTRAIACCC
jgi:hypothetical protein